MDSRDTLARNSLRLGHDYLGAKDYGRAFAHFLVALNFRKDFSVGLEYTFSSCLCEWGKHLEKHQRYDDLFKCYKQALDLYPNSKNILYNIGAHLLRIEHYNEAALYFRKSLQQDGNFLPPFKGLQNVSNLVIERWHFRMLNDSCRNRAFRNAIKNVIKKEKHSKVLDIGSGTGILSMFAADAGAEIVYACEHNEVMASLAEEIVKKNNFSGKIRVINKMSQDLDIPKDMPDGVSLIVSETFDGGLVGEGALLFLCDALRRLSKLYSTVLPRRATIFGTPFESAELARKYKTLRMPRAASSLPDLFSTEFEPYDTCHLSSVKDVVYLSTEIQLFSINLGDLAVLDECVNGITAEVNFICERSGFLDFIAVWFELDLCDGVNISTRPGEDSCWDQAIFPISGARFLHKGASVSFKFSLKGDRLTLLSEPSPDVPIVSMPAVAFLNDFNSTDKIESWLNNLKLAEKASVLEVLPFPVLISLDEFDGSITVVSEDAVAVLDSLTLSNPKCKDRLRFATICDLETLLESTKFHAIAVNFVEPCGELDETLIQMIPLFRHSLINSEEFEGQIYPAKITICCQLVSSDTLYACSAVIESKMSIDYKGVDCINSFKCCQMVGLRRGELGMKAASPPVAVATLSLERLCDDESARYSVRTEAVAPVHGVAYWFVPQMTDIVPSTISGGLETEFHWSDLALQIAHPPLDDATGSTVQIDLLYRMGIVKISLQIISEGNSN